MLSVRSTLVILGAIPALGCSLFADSNDPVDRGRSDAGPKPDAVLELDGGGICEAPENTIDPAPTPTDVAPGTPCVTDADCEAVEGFCRPLAAGGSECASFGGIGDQCGGLPAPSEQTRCLPGFECDAPDVSSFGVCVCAPNCTDKVCGSDGCGGSCGDCDGVCALEGRRCNDFAGDQCCLPIVVDSLPFERRGNTAGAADKFDVPRDIVIDPQPDDVVAFTPEQSGDYFGWGSCGANAVYEECGNSIDPLVAQSCDTIFGPDEHFRVALTAGEDYYFAEEGTALSNDEVTNGWVRRIHGPVTTIAELAPTSVLADLVPDSTHVYWSVENTVSRRAKDGSGQTQAILTSAGDVHSITLVGEMLYAVDRDNGLVLRVAKTGGAPEVVASGEVGIGVLAAGGDFLYWSITGTLANELDCEPNFDGVVRRIAIAGGVPEDVATGQEVVTDLDTDGSHVYWSLSREVPDSSCGPGPGIRRRLHSGGAIETFAAIRSFSRVVVADDAILVALAIEEPADIDVAYFWSRVDKATLAVSPESYRSDSRALAYDGTYIYVAESDFPGGPFLESAVNAVDENLNTIGMVPNGYRRSTHVAIADGVLYLNFDNQIISVPPAIAP